MQQIHTDKAPSYLSFMSQGMVANGFLFAVTVPRRPDNLEIPSTFEEQAEVAFGNLQAVLETGAVGWDGLVKLAVYLSDMSNWERMNEVYKRYVNLENPPVRITVQVARLHNEYMIELDAVALAAGR